MHCARLFTHKNYLIQILLYLHFTWRKLSSESSHPWGLKALAHHLFVHCLCQMLFRPEGYDSDKAQSEAWAVFSGKSHLMVPGTGRTRMASEVCFCLGILGFSPEFFFFFNICLKEYN